MNKLLNIFKKAESYHDLIGSLLLYGCNDDDYSTTNSCGGYHYRD